LKKERDFGIIEKGKAVFAAADLRLPQAAGIHYHTLEEEQL
jgi:hypothetical protein